jgi:hypothetical protein
VTGKVRKVEMREIATELLHSMVLAPA